MSDLIERGDAFKALWARNKHEGADLDALITMEDALAAVVSIPAVDAAEAKHGTWKIIGLDGNFVYCSVCHADQSKAHVTDCDGVVVLPYFCPVCGAKMDGGKDDAAD